MELLRLHYWHLGAMWGPMGYLTVSQALTQKMLQHFQFLQLWQPKWCLVMPGWQALEKDLKYCKTLEQNLNTEILTNEKVHKIKCKMVKVSIAFYAGSVNVSCEQSWSQPQAAFEGQGNISTSDEWLWHVTEHFVSISVWEAAWSSNLPKSDWVALWLLYSSVRLKSFSYQRFLTTLITQQSSQLYQAG